MIAEMFSYPFMQRAFAAGLVVSVTCSLLSFFVVLKRLSFAGAGISHSAFGGLALGLVLGIPPVLSAIAFSVLVAVLIGLTRRRRNVSEDTAIGIFFAASMAFGIMLLSTREVFFGDVFGYLFGNILAITRPDLVLIGVTGTIITAVIAVFFREFLFLCFDEEAASAAGLPVRLLEMFLLVLVALAVVTAIRVTGVVLVSALLVIPAATSRQVTDNYRGMLAGALACGVFSTAGGIVFSYRFNLPPGSTTVLLATAVFTAAFIIRTKRLLNLDRFLKQRPHP